jgi:hypothetical protein
MRQMSKMRRAVTALAIGATLFAAVYGLAASLGVTSGNLGAGDSAVAACQSGGLTTSYATTYSAAANGYEVGVLTVSGLDTSSPTNCASQPYSITISGAANASLAELTGTTPASGDTFDADFSSANVNAASVTGVHLVIG